MTRTLLLALGLLIAGCEPSPERLSLRGPIMGTSYSLQVIRAPGLPEAGPLRRLAETRLAELNQRLSTYVDDSDVSRFSRAPADVWVTVSEDTLAVMTAAQDIARASGGAFDVTVAPLVDLWGFGPAGQPERVPGEQEIQRLRGAMGFRHVELRADPPALRKSHPDLRIDLSAIAKGYAVDELAELLDAIGYEAYLVEIGGELRTRGRRLDGGPWRVALESPLSGSREVLRVLELSGESVASSGDYRNFFEHQGRRYSHTIDPRTGWPVEHGLGAVSVVAETCMEADAWATALMVLGAEAGRDLAREQGLAADFVVRAEDRFEERMTPAFRSLLESTRRDPP